MRRFVLAVSAVCLTSFVFVGLLGRSLLPRLAGLTSSRSSSLSLCSLEFVDPERVEGLLCALISSQYVYLLEYKNIGIALVQ